MRTQQESPPLESNHVPNMQTRNTPRRPRTNKRIMIVPTKKNKNLKLSIEKKRSKPGPLVALHEQGKDHCFEPVSGAINSIPFSHFWNEG